MYEIKNISKTMRSEAAKLNLGDLLIVYRDGNAIRCELEDGDDPYVWRNVRWVKMK